MDGASKNSVKDCPAHGDWVGTLLRMARPSRPDVPGAFYHVLARGNRRATIFHDDTDYRACLARYRQRDGLTLYAYVLMPNHLYLLLKTLFQPHQQTADPRSVT